RAAWGPSMTPPTDNPDGAPNVPEWWSGSVRRLRAVRPAIILAAAALDFAADFRTVVVGAGRGLLLGGKVVTGNVLSELNPGLRHRDPQWPVSLVLRNHGHAKTVLSDAAVLVRRTHLLPLPIHTLQRLGWASLATTWAK